MLGRQWLQMQLVEDSHYDNVAKYWGVLKHY